MRKVILATAFLLGSSAVAQADTDAQRMVGGGLFPVFVNGVGTTQVRTPGVYVNQTQVSAVPSSSGSRMSLTGSGR